MAGSNAILETSFIVNASLANGVTRYAALVSDTTDHGCQYATAVGAGKFVGVAQEDQSAGMPVNSRVLGTTWAIANGAITAGDDVILAGDANGRFITAVGAAGTPVVVGRALTHTTAAGDQFLLLLKP